MQIPVPVCHEIHGSPEPAPDPLPPSVQDTGASALIPFISINGEDPPPEMTPALNAHFPGWRPRSRAAETKHKKDDHGYRDVQTREPDRIVENTLEASSSQKVSTRAQDALANHARGQDLPAYEFKLRYATGPFLAGGGWGGHVVLIDGYWVKVGTGGWDE